MAARTYGGFMTFTVRVATPSVEAEHAVAAEKMLSTEAMIDKLAPLAAENLRRGDHQSFSVEVYPDVPGGSSFDAHFFEGGGLRLIETRMSGGAPHQLYVDEARTLHERLGRALAAADAAAATSTEQAD